MPPKTQQPIQIFQICYSPETLAEVPAGFGALNNLANPRPDWREYWPIRQYLLNHTLDENTLYGFFSPKFVHKTGLDMAAIRQFVDNVYQGEDVVSFSPFWDLSSLFLNVFEQGDFFHDGLLDASRQFVKAIGWDERCVDAVMHSRNSVFCNYFLATRQFWMQWLELGERLFAAAESNEAPPALAGVLNSTTRYGEERVPRKVFVMERLASLLLAVGPQWRTCPYDTFSLNPSDTPLNQFFHQAVSCDALKRAWVESGSPSAISSFVHTRDSVLRTLMQPAQPTLIAA